jgi:hypothetical protein
MSRDKIYAIVEGHGEGNQPPSGGRAAINVLIQKLLTDLQCWTLFSAEKHWRMSYSEFFHGDKLERTIRYHKSYNDCAALLVLLDTDDACPKTQAITLTKRIAAMELLPFSVVVVCAKKEFEAWFLASLESIENQSYDDDPEEKRDAKGWLRKQFGYKPTIHQARYTQKLDPGIAYVKSRSFRRLYHAFEEIVTAANNGKPVITPIDKA